MPVETTIKENLRKKNLTVVELSRRVGIPNSRMNAYINGYTKMPGDIRNKINVVLNGTENIETKKKPRQEWQIQNRMKKAGVTLTQLAIAVDVGYSKLCNYIGGRAVLPDDLRKKIEEVLDRAEEDIEFLRIENEKSEYGDYDDRYHDGVESVETSETAAEQVDPLPEFDPDEVF